ncbi:MAG: Holliday junction branch migration protein RuvA [Bacteroidetes bacterium]|nr:Holliday junction branch migration protein RuvA [Bacteroidota bacterium]
MIASLRGKFIRKTPSSIIVEAFGVGYELQVSLYTYDQIVEKEEGFLWTYMHLFENGQTLYGFATPEEKDLFIHLISVSGVGASTARIMLSGMKPYEIIKAIIQNDSKRLEMIKGIGKKTAERIVVDLKDKLKQHSQGYPELAGSFKPSLQEDACVALIALGLSKSVAEIAVKKVFQSDVEMLSLEDIIKSALKNL